MRLADYVAVRARELGVTHVFMITGGGSMHLNDALGNTPGLAYVCHHHEQACAIAAEGFARASGQLAMVNVTTGPGATNALTGVLGQWLDSIPALYISGQVRQDTSVASTALPLRQLGDQEAPVIEMVRPITKYAVTIRDPQSVRYHLERAVRLARTGRPGPVWLEVPLDVQGAEIDPTQLVGDDEWPADTEQADDLTAIADEVLRRIKAARRPVLLVGAGVRLAKAYDILHAVIEKLNIPVLVAWDAIDLVPSDHPLYCGRPSSLGQRAANLIFQNADLLLSVGCRLNVRQIGYNFSSVARAAYKIVVDIDPSELKKPTLRPDLPVCCDAAVFLTALHRHMETHSFPRNPEWLGWCEERRRHFVPVPPALHERTDAVDPYVFSEALSAYLSDDEVIVSSDGTACVVPIQAMPIRKRQRHIVNSGCAAMGYGLPAAIGASIAMGGGRVICLEGDGSLQLNIQELQTVVHHQLPLKIFVFNNGGYVSIRNTQRGFFNGRMVGEGPASGVSFPDLRQIAAAYGIPSFRISTHAEISTVQAVLLESGPVVCEVVLPSDYTFAPRVASSRRHDGQMVSNPLENMSPLLEPGELERHMIVPLWDHSKTSATR